MTEISNVGDAYRQPRDNQLYRPIVGNEIRVLEILPGGEDIIGCQLKYIKLDTPIEYNALSYTWGDPTKPKVTITVDGYSLKVTENCYLALRELRREAVAQSKTQIIWIDAICTVSTSKTSLSVIIK